MEDQGGSKAHHHPSAVEGLLAVPPTSRKPQPSGVSPSLWGPEPSGVSPLRGPEPSGVHQQTSHVSPKSTYTYYNGCMFFYEC